MPSEREYLQMFGRFFRKSRSMTSTYKPVFLRSLLDIGDYGDPARGGKLVGRGWITPEGGRLRVDLNFVAARFAKYYWDMEYSFKLKQSQVPMDTYMTRKVREEHGGRKKPPTLRELGGGGMSQFRRTVIRRGIRRYVLPLIQKDVGGLFEVDGREAITFDPGIVEFLRDNRAVIRKGLTGVLTGYLEKINKMTPQIANKVDVYSAARPALRKDMRDKIVRLQDNRCFYCREAIKRLHIDHVIPYNFVFSTDLYNCTAACQRCNCEKSDLLPEKGFFCRAIKRNRDIRPYMEDRKIHYDEGTYVRLFDVCAAEYSDGFFAPV